MWTDYSVMGKFETGRVYVVYQDKNVSILHYSTHVQQACSYPVLFYQDKNVIVLHGVLIESVRLLHYSTLVQQDCP